MTDRGQDEKLKIHVFLFLLKNLMKCQKKALTKYICTCALRLFQNIESKSIKELMGNINSTGQCQREAKINEQLVTQWNAKIGVTLQFSRHIQGINIMREINTVVVYYLYIDK